MYVLEGYHVRVLGVVEVICVFKTPLGYGLCTSGQFIPELRLVRPGAEKIYVVSKDSYQTYKGEIISMCKIAETDFWWASEDKKLSLTTEVAKKISEIIGRPVYIRSTTRGLGEIFVELNLPVYEVEMEVDSYTSYNNVYLHRVELPVEVDVPFHEDDDILSLKNIKIICREFKSTAAVHIVERPILFKSTIETKFFGSPIPEGYWIAYAIIR